GRDPARPGDLPPLGIVPARGSGARARRPDARGARPRVAAVVRGLDRAEDDQHARAAAPLVRTRPPHRHAPGRADGPLPPRPPAPAPAGGDPGPRPPAPPAPPPPGPGRGRRRPD